MIIEVVRSLEGIAALREPWNRLFRLTPQVSGFESHAWVSACASLLDPVEDQLRVAVISEAGQPVAIFPARLTRRRLGFIGTVMGNYGGPVFDPAGFRDACAVWSQQLAADETVRAIDLAGLRERSPFLQLIHEHGMPGWGSVTSVVTNTCPEVDLTGGLEGLLERHKSKQRSSWRRKTARLGRLGAVEFVELTHAREIHAALPRMVELWARRWAGRRVAPRFDDPGEFQGEAARRLAEDGLAAVSALRLDGEIIAFAYGVRGPGVTSSYVLAHDDRFDRFSPGLLLLVETLEAACRRGDAVYDFSLGEAPYKALWATAEQKVYRATWGRGRWLRAALSAGRARARRIEPLRQLKVGAGRNPRDHGEPAGASQHEPGLPAEPGTTHLYELPGGEPDSFSLRDCRYAEMRSRLDPELLELAIERSFRGDQLLVLSDSVEAMGMVWRAGPARRGALLDRDVDASAELYYHPLGLGERSLEEVFAGLAAAASGYLVSAHPIPAPLPSRQT